MCLFEGCNRGLTHTGGGGVDDCRPRRRAGHGRAPNAGISTTLRSTALASLEDEAEEITYLEKPIDLQHLTATIRRRLAACADAVEGEVRFGAH